MHRYRTHFSLLLLFSFAFALVPRLNRAHAQDLVATEDIVGGSSIFVFRESRKRPQARAASASGIREGGGGGSGTGRSGAARSNAQIAAAAQKRRNEAIAARKRQAAKAEANRKLALSNTLTAKAETLLEGNQTDAAIKSYRDALVQNPKNIRASDGLSDALTAKGIEVAGDTNNTASAIYFDEAVKYDKRNDVAYAKLGAVYQASGQRDKALASYEQAVALNADYTMLYAPLGMAYLDAGEVAKAESALQKADAARIDNIDVRYLRGLVFYKQNKNDAALAAVEQVLELDARFADAQFCRAQILDRLGRSDDAIASYKKTLEIEPGYAPASFELGVAYYNKADYNGAAAAYQDVVKAEPDNYQAHANLASSYRQLERFPEANAEYKLASVGIKTADLYSEWGYCLGKASDWEKAVARLKEAKDISPTAVDNSNLGWGYYNAAKADTASKDTEKAKTNYSLAKAALEAAVQQDPRLDAAYLNLGSTHNALGEFQAAITILTTVLSFRRDWQIAANQLGTGYRGLNDLKNAIATFKRVVDLDGRSTIGLYNLGEAYFASGNKNEAKKVNDKLRKLDPSMSARLDNILSGKVVIDAAKQKILQKVPVVPRIPRFPL